MSFEAASPVCMHVKHPGMHATKFDLLRHLIPFVLSLVFIRFGEIM